MKDTRPNCIISCTSLIAATVCLLAWGCSRSTDHAESGEGSAGTLTSSSHAKKADKVQQFIDLGMYPQAISALQQQINSDPTNADTHFRLGMCFVFAEHLNEAQTSFNRTIQLKPAKGKEIGHTLLSYAGQLPLPPHRQTESVLSMALAYDPSLRSNVSGIYLNAIRNTGDINTLISLTRDASGIDATISHECADALLSAARGARNINDLSRLISAASSLHPDSSPACAKILLGVAASNAHSLGERNTEQLIEQSDKLLSSRDSFVDLLYEALGNTTAQQLSQHKLALHRVILKKNLADEGRARPMLVRMANSLLEKDSALFADAMKQLTTLSPSLVDGGTPKEKYLAAVYYWRSNQRPRALDIFKSIDATAAKADFSAVMSPIRPGDYTVNMKKSGDFGWGTFEMTVESVTISPALEVQVKILVRNNSDSNQHFIFFGEQGAAKWNRYRDANAGTKAFHGAEDERFILADDFGTKLFATPPHFVGTRNRKNFNSSNDAVIMDPGQEISDVLKFGKISPDASEITFISPKHNGHQWEIAFQNIPIKSIEFTQWQE